MLGIPQQAFLTAQRAGSAGEPAAHLYDDTQLPAAAMLQLSPHRHVDLHALAQRVVRRGAGQLVPICERVTITDTVHELPQYPQGRALGERYGDHRVRAGRAAGSIE